MTKVTAWISKTKSGDVLEIWKSKPNYNEEYDEWMESEKSEVGSEIFDGLCENLVGNGECIKVEISVAE